MRSPITPRTRVWQALHHTQPDRVPWTFGYTVPARTTLERHFGAVDLDAVLDNHLVRYKTRLPHAPVGDGLVRDEWGVLLDQRVDPDIGMPTGQVLPARSFAQFRPPDPLDGRRFAALPAWIETHRERFRVISLGFSLFERAWTLRGMTDFMVDLVEDPVFAGELLDRILAWDLAVVDAFLKYDIDGIQFGDDWGQQRGLLFGRKRWQQIIKPRVAQLYSRVKAAGKAVMIHSCGNVQEIFPDLIEIGLDVFNPFQPEVMDLGEMKQRYGHALTFYGGVSVQRLLPFGTPEEVRGEVRRLLAEIGAGGGFIIAPSHDLPADVPLANMLAFIETVQTQ